MERLVRLRNERGDRDRDSCSSLATVAILAGTGGPRGPHPQSRILKGYAKIGTFCCKKTFSTT